jgi:GT2 family glycosyltransferase
VSDNASSREGALPTLDVVIVNWNGRHLLGECIGSLLANGYDDLRIVLVDNGSKDDSVAWCRDAFPSVDVVASPENLRWAGGNNLGIDWLNRHGMSDYVLFLNNDTQVPEGSLANLMTAVAEEPQAWAATPRICYAERPGTIWYDGGRVGYFSGWVSHQGIRQMAGRRPLRKRFVGYGTGCALLVSRSALQLLESFDEDFFLYGEDTDFCLRLREAGGRVLHVPEALVLHKVSLTVGADSPAKSYLKTRSHIRLLLRHWPVRRWPLLLPSQLLFITAQAAWHLWHSRLPSALALFRGLFDEIQDRPVNP